MLVTVGVVEGDQSIAEGQQVPEGLDGYLAASQHIQSVGSLVSQHVNSNSPPAGSMTAGGVCAVLRADVEEAVIGGSFIVEAFMYIGGGHRAVIGVLGARRIDGCTFG